MRLLLASASPRRAELLTAAGFSFDVLAVDADETVNAGESPERYVRRLAAEKSQRAQSELRRDASRTADHVDDVVVIGADTTVVVDAAILTKPVDEDDAREMLRRLGGRNHQVLTGVSLRRGVEEIGRVEVTTVTFAPLSEDEVDWYTSTGEGRDKAGGYAIQGCASRFIRRIEGSYTNVVGLPVAAVWELLRMLRAA